MHPVLGFVPREALFSGLDIQSREKSTALDVVSSDSLSLFYVFNVTSIEFEQHIHAWFEKVPLVESDHVMGPATVPSRTRPLFDIHRKVGRINPLNAMSVMAALSRGIMAVRDLIEDAETIDIVVVILGYVLMMLTFVFLFSNMKLIGSRASLGITTMLCGTLALACSLVTVSLFGQTISLLHEGIPFLVITVGFDKPFLLAKAILGAQEPDMDPSWKRNSESSSIPLSVRRKVLLGIDAAGPVLLRNYAMEIFILGVGAMTGIPALAQFCLVAALILLFDCLLMFTVFLAVLTLKMELKRIRDSDPETLIPSPWGLRKATLEDSSRSGQVSRTKILLISASVVLYAFNGVTMYSKTSPSLGRYEPNIGHGVEFMVFVDTTLKSIISSFSSPVVVDVSSPITFFLLGAGEPLAYRLQSILSGILSLLPVSIAGSFQMTSILLFLSVMANIYFLRVSRKLVDNAELSSPKIHSGCQTVTDVSRQISAPESASLNADRSSDRIMELSAEEALTMIKSGRGKELDDSIIVDLLRRSQLAPHTLEKILGANSRSILLRRHYFGNIFGHEIKEEGSQGIPFEGLDYSKVIGQCCENVVGYIPLPLGIAGPFRVDGKVYYLPMATTEGCLVASTSRGCKAISAGSGATTVLLKDGMTRGPVLGFSSLKRAAEFKLWSECSDDSNPSQCGWTIMKSAFDSTSRFARLKSLQVALAGHWAYVRFCTQTGDAMGMNMISKGVEKALAVASNYFPDMSVIALSGNYCTDKKPAAINWIEGRGKSVVSECIIPGSVIRTVLKTTVHDLVELNTAKNLVGSAMAGSVGGFNAHAANIVTAIFLACGQDPAQNVESSNCLTLMQSINHGQDLHMSCTMPSIEVGTVGGGTSLPAQAGCLDMLGVRGPNIDVPGRNAQQLARLVCATVMAGELSLMSALAAGHLVSSHMQHNRASEPASIPTVKVQAMFSGSCLKS